MTINYRRTADKSVTVIFHVLLHAHHKLFVLCAITAVGVSVTSIICHNGCDRFIVLIKGCDHHREFFIQMSRGSTRGVE